MAELVVLGFPNRERAEAVMELASGLRKQDLLDLEDSALVWRTADGKLKVQQQYSTTGAGAAMGAMWGGLFGLLFLMPVFGLAVGAATGAFAGKLTDIGIDDTFIKEIATELEPGTAAIFALVRRSTTDKVREALAEYHPTVLRTSLSKHDEQELAEALR